MTPDPKQDHLLDHQYDGIQEYDNPMPKWWIYIFWATIVWSVLYYVNVPGIGSGKGWIANYEREVEVANARRAAEEAKRPKLAAVTDASLMAAAHDPRVLEIGKRVFTTNCMACHREDGGGSIGPNLTDEYWLHGGTPAQIHGTVQHGVLDKGMPAWETVLPPEEVRAVAAYVLTLYDTHPKDPKAPQGTKVEREESETHEGGE